jgi:hypothetical protein
MNLSGSQAIWASSRRLTYLNANAASWSELIAERPENPRPIGAHIPIQPAYSPDIIHVDAALNAVLRPIYPDENALELHAMRKLTERRLMLVQFALGTPPFLPNPLLSKLECMPGDLPQIRATYFAYDLLYDFRYFTVGLGHDTVAWIEGNVINQRKTAAAVDVRFRVGFPTENQAFDYHYAPFRWDVSRWGDWPCVRLEGDLLLFDGVWEGRCFPGDFKISWENSQGHRADDFESAYPIAETSRVLPEFRLLEPKNAVHLTASLTPGQSASFKLAIRMNRESNRKKDLPTFTMADCGMHREKATTDFSAAMKTRSEFVFPSADWDRIFSVQQRSIKQLLLEFEGETSLMPTQGGSSERHFVWVWEAVHALIPLIQLGHFNDAKRALEFIFRLQDGGYPPEGRYTSLAGAIGTTGPRWANTTGAALALAQEYASCSGDEVFLATYLPPMIRAGEWIVREIKATRRLAPDGHRPPTWGLMPWAHSTDGDQGQVITFTDAYSYWGLNKLSTLLQEIGHPRTPEFAKECRTYRDDILEAVHTLSSPDGNIQRVIPAEGDLIYKKFDILISAAHLGFVDALDVNAEPFSRFVNYFETRQADGFFCAPMDHDVAYVVFAEFLWQNIYLRRGEWKKAFCTLQSTILSSMTLDTFAVQERVSKKNPLFVPWQPNASGSGRILQMMINALYFRDGDSAVILGGVPWEWLLKNRITALRNLNTPHGVVSLEVQALQGAVCAVSLLAGDRFSFPRYLKLNEEYEVLSFSPGLRLKENSTLEIRDTSIERLSFQVRRRDGQEQ